MSITAGWLIVAILCIRLLFRRMPKWVSCLLWGMVAVRLVFPFSIESVFSLQPSAEPIQSSTVVGGEILPYVPSVDSNFPVVENTINPILAESFAYERTDSAAPLQVFTEVAGVAWAVGFVILLGFAIVSMVRLALLVKEAVPYKDKVYICDAVKSPFILGMIRPRIFLSSSLTEEEREYIMAHETAHLKRKDHLWKPLGYLLLSVYWFHPLCWLAYLMLCKDIELACDEKVIRDMNFADKKEYSRVLLSCAAQRRMVMTCPLAFGEVGVKERVKTVLNYKKPAFWITIAAVVVCIVLAICFLTNPEKEYQIRITIPAGSTEEIVSQEAFFYSDEEISPTGNKITISLGEGLGDTQVVLKPMEGKDANAYEPTYITPGMPVKMDVEKGAWFQIGVNMQNPTAEDLHVYVVVKGVEVRISAQAAQVQQIGEADDENTTVDTPQTEALTTMQNLAYYLELSEPDLEFQDMSEERRSEILSEYGELLAEYTLMARESTDGKTEYVVGCFEGEVKGSPLYQMQTYEVSGKETGWFQILYLEENFGKVDQIISTEGVSAITDEGYVLEDSRIFWTADKKYIMIVPVNSEEDLSQTFCCYYNPSTGSAYIEDAIERGIALNSVMEPYLTVSMISEKYGEISERIELSEDEASSILAEEKKMLPEGTGMATSLTINGDNIYFGANGVPQSVLDLAVERCGYRFETPKDITAPIIGARLDCDWLDEPLYAGAEDLSRLEEILKDAKYTGVGNCGYGAKLTITLENQEELIIFKGTDDCGSFVFGSYGGYSISDEADDAFWEIFGLPAGTEERFAMQQEANTPLTEVPVNTLSDVTMIMEKYKSWEGDIEILNQTGKELQTSEWYDMQKWEAGEWHRMDPLIDGVFSDVLYRIPTGETTVFPTNWKMWYGDLSAGKYRIRKEIYETTEDEVYTHYLAVEFELY